MSKIKIIKKILKKTKHLKSVFLCNIHVLTCECINKNFLYIHIIIQNVLNTSFPYPTPLGSNKESSVKELSFYRENNLNQHMKGFQENYQLTNDTQQSGSQNHFHIMTGIYVHVHTYTYTFGKGFSLLLHSTMSQESTNGYFKEISNMRDREKVENQKR